MNLAWLMADWLDWWLIDEWSQEWINWVENEVDEWIGVAAERKKLLLEFRFPIRNGVKKADWMNDGESIEPATKE